VTLPTFLVVGAMKAGTTSLFEYLRGHPDVFMPPEKELCYFCGRLAGDRDLTWYERQFDDAAHAVAIGEAAPVYAWYPAFPGVPERATRLISDVRVVYLVRDPVERIRSQYLHARARGSEARGITRAVLETPDYIDVSRYGVQLRRWLDWVDESKVLVVPSEALREERSDTLADVLRFIGVDPTWRPDDLHVDHHRTCDRLQKDEPDVVMPAPLVRYLEDVLAEDVAFISRWIGPWAARWGRPDGA